MSTINQLATLKREVYAQTSINHAKVTYGYETRPDPKDCNHVIPQKICINCQPEIICEICGNQSLYITCPWCCHDSILENRAKIFDTRIPKAIKNPLLNKPRDDEQAQIFSQVIGWLTKILQGRRNNLVFVGHAGSGKTHTAFAVLRLLNQRFIWYNGVYCNMSTILPDLKNRFSKRQTPDEVLEKFFKPFLLVIDELMFSKNQDAERELLYRLINERWEKELPMILISNMGKDEFEEKMGQRLFSRINANGTKFIEFQERDYRNWQDKD
jgi:DNA replication protein DnaC